MCHALVRKHYRAFSLKYFCIVLPTQVNGVVGIVMWDVKCISNYHGLVLFQNRKMGTILFTAFLINFLMAEGSHHDKQIARC